MDANFPANIAAASRSGLLTSTPARLGAASRSGLTANFPAYLFSGNDYPYDVTILSVIRLDDGKVEIDYTITCAFPNPPCPNVSLVANDCEFSSDGGLSWRNMTPDTGNPDHDAGPFTPDGTTTYTYIWNAPVDVYSTCKIENYLVRLKVTDGVVSNLPSNGVGSTDDFINIVYTYPENDKIYVGFVVNTFDTEIFCLESVEWSKDGVTWNHATNAADDPLNSQIPRQTHQVNVFVWDWQKDTTDANGVCIRFNVYKLGATEPEITRIPQIRFDRSYSNGVGDFYDGWVYAHGGGSANVADVKSIRMDDGTGKGYIVVHDVRDIANPPPEWIPGVTLEISSDSIVSPNLGNKVVHSFIGDTIYFTTTFASDEDFAPNTVVALSDSEMDNGGDKLETFFRVNPTTYEIEYDHIKVLDIDMTHQPTLDKDGQVVSISRQFSQSHAFVDKTNGNWVLIRGARNNDFGTGSVMQIMYWNFEKKFWKVTFRNSTGYYYLSNQQAATWVQGEWFYWLGGYQLGQAANSHRPCFFRIRLDSIYTGDIICEDLLPNSPTVAGYANQSVNQYRFGTWFNSKNPVSVEPGVLVAPYPGLNSFARYDCRGCVIPDSDGKAIIPGGSCNTQYNPDAYGIWSDALIYDPVTHSVRTIPLPNDNGSNGFRLYPQNGAVVMLGGSDRLNSTGVLYTYDPCFDLWRNSGYPDDIANIDRPFSAFDEDNNQWYTFGGAVYSQQLTNVEGKLISYIDLQRPKTDSSGTECNVFTNHSDTWNFGPGEEFEDFNAAWNAMVNYFHGEPLPGDQFFFGSGGTQRKIMPLNGGQFRLNTNNHKIVIASKDKNNRVKFTGDVVIPNNTFLKYIEALEPKEETKVWKTDWLKCNRTQPFLWVDIYENGEPLTEVNSLALAEATPGTYYLANDWELFIHASDSSNIRNGTNTYEVTLYDVFKWESIDANDQCHGISFIDLDIVHGESWAVRLYGASPHAFDNALFLNCRFRTQYGSLQVYGCEDGITIKNCSFITENNDRGEYSGHVDIGDALNNIVFTQNYMWMWGNGSHVSLGSTSSNGDLKFSDNIMINGDYPLYIACDNIKFERNIFRFQNLNRPNYENLFEFTHMDFVGNAIIGAEKFTAISIYNYTPTILNIQNNTYWSDRNGAETIMVSYSGSLTPFELNIRLNIWMVDNPFGGLYPTLPGMTGVKESNVYFYTPGNAGNVPAGEFKSKSAPYREIFPRPLSYTEPIDRLSILPVDGFVKNIRRRIPTDPPIVDVTGGNTPCLLSAGCIQQVNEHGSYSIESYRWLPQWINQCSMPDNLLTENFTKLPNKKRTFVDEDCMLLPDLIFQNKILLLDNFVGTQNYRFTLQLSKAVAYSVTVNLQSADGTALAGVDYTATTQTITFAPFETTKNVTISIIGDGITEHEQNWFINLISTECTINGNIEVIIQDSGAILDADYLVIRMVGDSVVTGGDYMVSNTFLSDPYTGAEVGSVNYKWTDGNRLQYGGDDHLTEYPQPQEEEVLINVNNINQNIFSVCIFGYWRAYIHQGDRTISVKAFKGGTMSVVSSRFVNTGGTLIGETPGVVRNTTLYVGGQSDGDYLLTVTYDKTSKRVGFRTDNNCQAGWADRDGENQVIPMTNDGGSLRLNWDTMKVYNNSYNDLAYIICEFTPTQNGNYYIRTNNGGPMFGYNEYKDTELWWYDTDRIILSSIYTDYNDDFYGVGTYSRIPSGLGPYGTIPLLAGTTYYLVVRPWNNEYEPGYEFDIQVRKLVPPVITSDNEIYTSVGSLVNYQATALNGPVTWSSTTLPTGYTLNAVSGQISGVLLDMNTLSFTLTATNEDGPTSMNISVYVAMP